MTTVSILPVTAGEGSTLYHAVAGDHRGAGMTPGEALDAILDQDDSGTLVVVQRNRPDQFFTLEQQARLAELMMRWRCARETGTTLASEEQVELERLVDAELHGAGRRAAALADELAK